MLPTWGSAGAAALRLEARAIFVTGPCGEGQFCNGLELCAEGICQTGVDVDCGDGVPCTADSCDEAADSCAHAPCTLGASAEGSRHLVVTPPPGLASVALRVSAPELNCLPKFLNASGRFTDAPFFRSSAQRGAVDIGDRAIVPATRYTAAAEVEPGAPIASDSVATGGWGDVDGRDDVNVFDFVCVRNGFFNIFTRFTRAADDPKAGIPDRQIDLEDIQAVLDAFSGMPYPDADSCSAPPPALEALRGTTRPRARHGD